MDDTESLPVEIPGETESAMCEVKLPDDVGAHLAAGLIAERDQIAAEWRDALEERLALPANRVLPDGADLRRIAELVEYLARAVAPEPRGGPGPILDTVGDLVALRRGQGYPCEELFMEVDLLAELLFEHLYDALGGDTYVTAGAAAAATACLSDALRKLDVRMARHFLSLDAADEDGETDVVATLQHQLRDPLTVIMQSVELLGEELAEETREGVLERLQRSVDRSAELIESIPKLLRANGGECEAQPLRVVVRRVIDEVDDSLPGRDVHVNIATTIPDIDVDGPNTALVLHNLIANSIKYADPTKEDRWVRIEFAPGEADGEWVVQVGDNGLGIGLDKQERIFERFFRGHGELAEGQGLGLAIVREAVERMGGRIGLESEEGHGSTFHFTVQHVGDCA